MREKLVFEEREEFRTWLMENSKRQDGIWITFGKNGKLKTMKADEALEEALCFGWIDGQLESIDESRYLKYFSPRRKGSNWSDKNKKLVEKLLSCGLMTEDGIQAVEEAKQDGTWDAPTGPGITGEQINAFAEVIRINSKAYENFQKMPASVKKQFTGLYLDAKKEETRVKRLEKLMGLLESNKKPM